jgi:hypothetical protein
LFTEHAKAGNAASSITPKYQSNTATLELVPHEWIQFLPVSSNYFEALGPHAQGRIVYRSRSALI